jgi:opacity protein-like surface antigen
MKRLTIMLTLAAAVAVFAAQAPAFAPATRAMGYFSLGLHVNDMKEFQSRLDRSGVGYPAEAKNYLVIGGGGLFCGRRLVVGGEGFGLISPQRAGGGYRTSLSGGYGIVQVGYAVINAERFTLYPLLGFGGGAFTWRVQRDVVPSSFEETIERPEMGVSLLNASFILQAALGADYWLRLGQGDRGTSCLVIGLRLGYTYSPFGDNWELQMYDQASELAGGPTLGITGPFLRLVVGWGGLGRNRR